MSKPILEIQNLSFQFGSNVVLKNLNFKINKNENWQIGGPSGTGKTTLAKIISNEIKNFEGNIKINFDELIKVITFVLLDHIASRKRQTLSA